MGKKKHRHTSIAKVPILEKSGPPQPTPRHFEVLKKHQYSVVKGLSITGRAPKDFIRVYEFGHCQKEHFPSWPLYIAKTGHKWYPSESITEYINNQIGKFLGFNIADCKLVIANEQLRFLSKYFKRNEESLVHGAELFIGYLEDENFFAKAQEEQREPELFTIETVKETLDYHFQNDADGIYCDYLKMLLFDAFIGSNDRHHYNWGVITDIRGKNAPRFSPIFDSARALFWNNPERNIKQWFSDGELLERKIEKYIQQSKPRVGLDNQENISHIDVVFEIYSSDLCRLSDFIEELFDDTIVNNLCRYLQSEFHSIISNERLDLICRYLQKRVAFIRNEIFET